MCRVILRKIPLFFYESGSMQSVEVEKVRLFDIQMSSKIHNLTKILAVNDFYFYILEYFAMIMLILIL